MRPLRSILPGALAATICIASCATAPRRERPLDRINHVVVIYQENWSFDGLFGKFPGANGLANAAATVRQVDRQGNPYPVLPQPIDNRNKAATKPDSRFPADLPVAPFDVGLFVPPEGTTGNPVHRFYQQMQQIAGGKMDGFVAWTDVGGLVMSYYDATELPVGKLAQEYVLADNFFHAAFGGSFLNHAWLVCACTPVWPGAPAEMRAQLDERGFLVKDGEISPDGYVINTAYTVNRPHPAGMDAKRLLPNQTLPTIGDRLSERQISWAWYSGGWNDAVGGKPHPVFQFHHQPFAYFATYADGTPGRAQHLKDEEDFLADLKQGRLPSVSFVKPLGPDNEHPGYASLLQGQLHVAQLVRAIMDSPYWAQTAIIITYDENGGRWDHVPPPKGDRWGPGARVPTVVVSQFAKKHHVDHTLYDTTSILKFIETRWDLRPLGSRDAVANDLTAAFDFGK